MARILICRPQGGLNDQICQISKCLKYCETYKRILIVDGSKSPLSVSFGKYFQIAEPKTTVYLDLNECPRSLIERIQHLSASSFMPPLPENFVFENYRYRAISEKNIYFEGTDKAITFDFKRDYFQEILLHHQFGGGLMSAYIFKKIKLRSNVISSLTRQIADIGDFDAAVHIRNTDTASEYKKILRFALNRFRGKSIFVATDSLEVYKYCCSMPCSEKFKFNTESIKLQRSCVALHKGKSLDIDNDAVFLQSIVDLFLLAIAPIYCFSTVKHGGISGYSMLASILRLANILDHSILPQQKFSRGKSSIFFAKPISLMRYKLKVLYFRIDLFCRSLMLVYPYN